MTDDAPQSATGCPDGGACHHHCVTGCWRVATCSPMSAYGETWTRADRKAYGNVVQDWPADPQASGVHWPGTQGRILRYLHDFVAEHGYPPSMDQIGAAVGLTSTSSVAHQLQVLEARGHIRREPGVPRAITILTHPSDTTPAVDWRDMFRRYADWVAEVEGVDFLYPPGTERMGGLVSPWTPEEWAAIDTLTDQ